MLVLSRLGLLKLNRDFWRPEDNVRDSGAEYPKLGPSRKNRDDWSSCIIYDGVRGISYKGDVREKMCKCNNFRM